MSARLHVRGRLFVASIVVVTAVIAVAGIFAEVELRDWLEARIEAELATDLSAARIAAELSPTAPDDALADRLGVALGVRVTFIDADGVVRGDSEVDATQLASVENHAGRLEVQRAFAGARGRDRRTSATVHKDMLYLAERTTRSETGVVRVAADYNDVDAAVLRLRFLLAMAGAMGFAAAVAMSAVASQLLSRTLRSLVVQARSLVNISFEGDDIGGLADTLQRLADDLTRTVNALASERDRFAALLEAMREGVVALDVDGKIVLVNAAARDMLRIDRIVTGRSLLEVARAPVLDDVARRARAGEVASAEIDLLVPRQRSVLVHAAPVRAGGGAVLVLHDVTELRHLERVRRDFVGNVSHELRTPVSVIRASAETLLAGVDGDAARTFLEAIERNATRLSRLVADLLDLSRIEAGEVVFEHEPLAIAELCRRAVLNVDGEARRNHDIVVAVEDALVGVGDAKAIDQVLVNLLDNALKYTPAGGHINIGAHVVDGAVRVEVRDDGPGIEAHHRARVFERFYRVDAGRSRDVGGTGLGLAIVKHLVEEMGGQAGVEAVAPHGSLFFFTLPRGDRS